MSRTYRKPWNYFIEFFKEEGVIIKNYSKLRVRDGTFTRPAKSCQRGGGCDWCYKGRMYKHRKKVSLKEELKIYLSEKGTNI